ATRTRGQPPLAGRLGPQDGVLTDARSAQETRVLVPPARARFRRRRRGQAAGPERLSPAVPRLGLVGGIDAPDRRGGVRRRGPCCLPNRTPPGRPAADRRLHRGADGRTGTAGG